MDCFYRVQLKKFDVVFFKTEIEILKYIANDFYFIAPNKSLIINQFYNKSDLVFKNKQDVIQVN